MEAEWIRAAASGDDAAYQRLIETYREPVFRLAYLISGDANEAEDVAQDTFIRAHRALPRFDATRAFRPWILRIAANAARNRRRSAGRYWNALQRLASQSPREPAPSIEQRAIQNADAEALWRAIRRLKPAEQEIIYLRYFLNLSGQETAEALNIGPGAVKSRLHRALKRLRALIESDFPHLIERTLS